MFIAKDLHCTKWFFYSLLFWDVSEWDTLRWCNCAWWTFTTMSRLQSTRQMWTTRSQRIRCQCWIYSLRFGQRYRSMSTNRHFSNSLILSIGTRSRSVHEMKFVLSYFHQILRSGLSLEISMSVHAVWKPVNIRSISIDLLVRSNMKFFILW